MKARRARLKAVYEGKDITADVSPFLKAFSFSEVLSGEADSASLTLQDVPELWIGDWFPERGAMMELTMAVADWQAPEDAPELPLGKFEVDEIENSAPPNEAKIKLVSIPNNAEIRSVEKTRSWEKARLSEISRDIADGAGMTLFYDTEEDPMLERAEQSEETDLSCLKKLTKDAGLALKVTDKTIAIFDEKKYEAREEVMTLTRKDSAIVSFSARATIHNIYKSCHVKYQHQQKDEFLEYTFDAPGRESGMKLEVNEKVETMEEAEKLAKKRLREKNREEITVSITVPGNFVLAAGNTVGLAGFHVYDGKYIITRAAHEIGTGGYTTKIELRRCLDGY
ncbi:MAG: hypothetical protein IJS96_03450 [Schwartzia sp.]|nr:hypothetical protein [Schwartzia sp. (in: firmicutes)]